MPDYDPPNQNTPAATRLYSPNGLPTVAALVAAINGSAFASRYPADFLRRSTKNDLIFICRTHGIAVAGINLA